MTKNLKVVLLGAHLKMNGKKRSGLRFMKPAQSARQYQTMYSATPFSSWVIELVEKVEVHEVEAQ